MKCKGVDGLTHIANWLFVKNAYVPAITVCVNKLVGDLRMPLRPTTINAQEIEFNNSVGIEFTANVPKWIKWTQPEDGSDVVFVIDVGTDNGVTEENTSLNSIKYYTENNLSNNIEFGEGATRFAYNSYWGSYPAISFQQNVVYYVRIVNPVSGTFNTWVGFD